MSLEECLNTHTERQMLAWLAWLDSTDRWNKPDRHDWYVMSLVCAVRRIFAKNPGEIQPEDCKLVFRDKMAPEANPETPTTAPRPPTPKAPKPPPANNWKQNRAALMTMLSRLPGGNKVKLPDGTLSSDPKDFPPGVLEGT